MDNTHNFMETENITKLIIRFSLPAMIGMFINALYNVVDRIFIARLDNIGSIAISAVGLCFPIMIISFSFTLLLGVGASACVSLTLGKKNFKSAEKYLGVMIFLSTVISLILTFICIVFIKEILNVIGASSVTYQYAKDYLLIVSLGFFPVIISNSLNSIIRVDGNPKVAMHTLVIGAVINIILDPILIFNLHLGVKGAAIATLISQIVSMIWTISYFMSKKSRLKIKVKYIRFNKRFTFKILSLGSAAFAGQLAFSMVQSTFNVSLLKYGGDLAIGVLATAQSIIQFLLMPIFGLNQGLQPILGYNYGAQKYKRVLEALKIGCIIATVIATFNTILVRIIGVQIIHIFTTDETLVKLSYHAVLILTVMMPIVGFQIVSTIYFQAVGKPMLSLLIGLSRQLLILIPCLIILSKLFGLMGIWYAMPVADFLATALTAYLIAIEIKKLKEKRDA